MTIEIGTWLFPKCPACRDGFGTHSTALPRVVVRRVEVPGRSDLYLTETLRKRSPGTMSESWIRLRHDLVAPGDEMPNVEHKRW